MAARVYCMFEDVADDPESLKHLVLEVLGVGIPGEELDHYVAWLLEVLPDLEAKAAKEAERTARMDPVERTLRAKRSSDTVEPIKPLAAALLLEPPRERKRWRTTREAKRAEAETPDARATAERMELDRWAAQSIEILKSLDAPVVRGPDGELLSDRHLRHAVGKRRASTLRARVRYWKRWWAWAQARRGNYRKVTYLDAIDFLEATAEGKCGITVPKNLYNAIAFFEKAGGLVGHGAITDHALVLSTAEALTRDLSAGNPVVRRDAPRLPVLAIVSMELTVTDSSQLPYLRFLAGFRLLKVWASMRFDDTLGITPKNIEEFDAGFKIPLDRTKTSGPDRRVKVLYGYVCKQAAFVEPGWLTVFMSMLGDAEGFGFARDYLLPLPEAGWMAPLRVRATHADATALGRSLLDHLRQPAWVRTDAGRVKWSLTHMPLFAQGAAEFWTEHSERKVASSLAAARGIDKARRDMLGRWAEESASTRGSADYVQTAAQIVVGVQRQVATSVTSLASWYSEADLKCWFGEFVMRRGLHAKLMEDTFMKLDFTTKGHPFNTMDVTSTSSSYYQVSSPPEAPVIPEDVHANLSDTVVDKTRKDASSSPFWVSISLRRGFRRLHKTGGCWFTAESMEYVADLTATVYDAKCGHCWKDREFKEPDVIGESSSVDTSDETSSSDTP